MNVQSISCQPLKPSYQLQSKPAFGNCDEADYSEDNGCSRLRKERDDFASMARNKDNKLISSIGTLGMGVAAGALSFFTFKAMAPKGWQVLTKTYKAFTDLGFVKESAKAIKESAVNLKNKVAKWYSNIEPESRVGKTKKFVSEKWSWLKEKTVPLYKSAKEKWLSFAQKHNWTKDTAKAAVNNTGATLVAIPASVTAINSDLQEKLGGME